MSDLVAGNLFRGVKTVFYHFVQFTTRMAGVWLFDVRSYDRHFCDVDGAALILSTHQSHFDPVLIGTTFNERLSYVARRTLFGNRVFGLVITLLDAIELDRDRSGLAGLKETLRRLKAGKKVLLFPEGTRTPDGKIAPLKPGFLSVARRSQVPLIPIAITGAYDSLPRHKTFPRRYPLHVCVGQRISYSDYSQLSDEATLSLISQRLADCYRKAQASREDLNAPRGIVGSHVC